MCYKKQLLWGILLLAGLALPSMIEAKEAFYVSVKIGSVHSQHNWLFADDASKAHKLFGVIQFSKYVSAQAGFIKLDKLVNVFTAKLASKSVTAGGQGMSVRATAYFSLGKSVFSIRAGVLSWNSKQISIGHSVENFIVSERHKDFGGQYRFNDQALLALHH